MPSRLLKLCFCSVLTAAIAAAPLLVVAAPPRLGPAQRDDVSGTLDAAVDAWRKGNWTEVRDLLEPLVRDGGEIADPLQRELVLRYLADATLFDESLDERVARTNATRYVERQFEANEDWTPPPSTHGSEFYALVDEVRAARDTESQADCAANRLACEADLAEKASDNAVLEKQYGQLKKEYDEDEIPVVDRVARNRAVALVPFGVGHFYNGNNVLGGSFLAAEVAIGATGLGLMLNRVFGFNCRREGNSFAAGSLVCRPPPGVTDRQITVQRNLEQTFGFLFIGAVVVDVVVAQALFKKTRIVSRGKKPRAEVERELEEAESRSSSERERPKRRKRDQSPSARLRVQPVPVYVPTGAGFGIRLEF